MPGDNDAFIQSVNNHLMELNRKIGGMDENVRNIQIQVLDTKMELQGLDSNLSDRIDRHAKETARKIDEHAQEASEAYESLHKRFVPVEEYISKVRVTVAVIGGFGVALGGILGWIGDQLVQRFL